MDQARYGTDIEVYG